jgi:nitrate/nitrite transport system substrate-binding protein
MSDISRRKFIATAGISAVGAIALNACGDPTTTTTSTPTPAVNTGSADSPETTKAKFGFIALTDSSPLIIAKVKGYFDKYGMTEVEVAKQASWGTTRDNLVLGSEGGGIDGAHILTPMPYLISEGIVTNGKKVPMHILARLNVNGQGICLSNKYKDLAIKTDSSPLKAAFAKVKEPKAAMTFPGGTHDMWIRYWLAAGGIDPVTDISTIVVPPAQMIANVKVGNMDTFCVGEPWPLQLVNQSIGYNALTTGELWKNHPEKALGMRADYVEKYPKATKAIVMAVQEAQIWCDQPENRKEMCEIVSNREWFNVPFADIIDRTNGKFDMGDGRIIENSPLLQKYWAEGASYPYKSHDLWFLTENIRWGYLPTSTDTKKMVDTVNREDIWREAAKAIGQEAMIPASTSRGVETFFDGIKFDPENPKAYLDSLKIKKLKTA